MLPTVSSVYLPTPPWHNLMALKRTDQKTDKPDGKPLLCQKTFSLGFLAAFLKSNCTV
jgi:hypothetical protein